MMRLDAYRQHLLEQGSTSNELAQAMELAGKFAAFLTDLGPSEKVSAAGRAEIEPFAAALIASGRNTPQSFATLCDFAVWLDYRNLYVALVELTDCDNALAVLADEIERAHGEDVRDRVFVDPLPPLGAREAERCAYTLGLMDRMAPELTSGQQRAMWFRVQHGLPDSLWRESDAVERKKYRECGSVDAYLARRRQDRMDLLERLHDEGKLWYTAEITDEVLEFVRSNEEIQGGRREGDAIYVTKFPYNAAAYLAETDQKRKRYYACHCPLVREAILNEQPVSPEVCNCTLGFVRHNLAGLGMELQGEVLESAVMGNSRCRLVFHLPDGWKEDRAAGT